MTYYNLSELGTFTFTGIAEDDFLAIFNKMSNGSELNHHVNTNLSLTLPESRGILGVVKIDDLVASLQFTGRSSGKLFFASFVKTPLAFSGWHKAMTPEEEAADDVYIEQRVAAIEAAIGDLSLMDHYGGDVVSVLNKYTRQVLVDSSPNANKIKCKNYYGNIQDISYDSTLFVQVANNSVDGVNGEITFEKDIYKNAVYVRTDTKTFPLVIGDLSGSWDSVRQIGLNDLTKNVFYHLIKRKFESSPGVWTDMFVILASAGESEISAVQSRVGALEGRFSQTNVPNDTFNIYKILATSLDINDLKSKSIDNTNALSTGSLSTPTGSINNLTINSALTLSASVPKVTFYNGVELKGTSSIASPTISGTLNISNCSVSLKGSPGNTDLVNKKYVDDKAVNTVNAKFTVSWNAPPATGTAGTFWFQL